MIEKIYKLFKSPITKKISVNIFWLFFDKALRMGLGIFVVVALSRHLGPTHFGTFNYIISFVSLFTALSALGLNAIVVRDLIEKERKYITLGTTFVLKFFGGILSYLLLLLTVYILRADDKIVMYLVSILGFILIFKSSDVVKFYFESRTESKKVIVIENIVFLVFSIFKLLLIYFDAELEIFVFLLFLESFFVFISLLIYYNKKRDLKKWKFNISRAKDLLSDSWPLIISSAAWVVYSKVDQIMIGDILGDVEVGYYAAATKLSEVTCFFPSIITFSIVPSILKYKLKDRKQYDLKFQHIYNFVTSVLLFLAVFVTLFSNNIIVLLYGVEYLPSSDVLKIHFWIVIFIGLATISGRYLVNDNMQRITMVRHLLGVFINIPLNYFLIQKFGIEGAAYASLISLILVNYFYDFINFRTRHIFWHKTEAIFFKWLWKLTLNKLR